MNADLTQCEWSKRPWPSEINDDSPEWESAIGFPFTVLRATSKNGWDIEPDTYCISDKRHSSGDAATSRNDYGWWGVDLIVAQAIVYGLLGEVTCSHS